MDETIEVSYSKPDVKLYLEQQEVMSRKKERLEKARREKERYERNKRTMEKIAKLEPAARAFAIAHWIPD